MSDKRIIEVDGDTGSGDIRLNVTGQGEYEIITRLEKMVGILTEVGIGDLEEPFKFFQGEKDTILAMVKPTVRTRILAETRRLLDGLIERDSKVVEQVVAEMSKDAMLEAGTIKE